MSSAARALVSEAEFLALPETNQRVELLDGEVLAAPSPSLRHQEALSRLVHALRDWADGCDATVIQAPMDVRFGKDRILQPDAMVFLHRLPLETETPLDIVPELCIEVLPQNRPLTIPMKSVQPYLSGTGLWVAMRPGARPAASPVR